MKFDHMLHTRRLAAIALFLVAAGCGQQKAPDEAAAPEKKAETPAEKVEAPAAVAKVAVTTASDEARAAFEEGRALLDGLKFVDANAAFRRAVELDPDFAFAHAMVAQTALSNAEFFEAVEKAKGLASGASDGEQLIIGALVAASENKQDAQLAMLKRLVAAYPKDERAHARLGTYLFGLQDYTGAVEHFGHATDINPDFAPAYNMRGYALRNLEKFDEAKGEFERYIELIPSEPNPYDSYAELLMEMGAHEQSIDNYRKALEIDPTFSASYTGIARNYSLMGEKEAAATTVEDMLASARNYTERQAALLEAVLVEMYAGDTTAAEAACEAALASATAENDKAAMANVREYMGDMMLDADNPEKAEEHFGAALDLRLEAVSNDANRAQARRAHLFKTAIASMKAGDTETATARTAEYRAAAEANGTAFEKRRIHMLEGFLAMMNEDYESSAEHLAQASQTNPIVLYWSAKAQKALGNMDKARDFATRAANRNTLSPNLPFVRNDALELLKELDSA
jgi:superkiller protein 3